MLANERGDRVVLGREPHLVLVAEDVARDGRLQAPQEQIDPMRELSVRLESFGFQGPLDSLEVLEVHAPVRSLSSPLTHRDTSAPTSTSSHAYHSNAALARPASAFVPQMTVSVRVVWALVLVRWASFTALAHGPARRTGTVARRRQSSVRRR